MDYRQLLNIMLDDMTQEELALELHTTQATISRWLKGQEPRGAALERIRKLARQKRLAQDATILQASIDEASIDKNGEMGGELSGDAGYDLDDPESAVFRASTLSHRRLRACDMRPDTTDLRGPQEQPNQTPAGPGDIANFTIQAGMGNGGALSVQLGDNGQVVDPADCDGFWSFPDKVKAGWRHMPQTYAMQVTGDSMEPSLSNGSYVFIDTSHTYPAPPDLYAVDYGHGLMIKRVELLPNEQIRIMSDNERYSSFDFHVADVTVYGRVVASFAFR